ncbi:hypothetical protein HAX54_005326 [Datura stramonium]|uniref:Uncharacterized protein n=1 Tax=Datura stramonium TaxID=4076 RepID=A0ABS8T9R1_DATST|nr:hypothetical protein [Datura stramonium]
MVDPSIRPQSYDNSSPTLVNGINSKEMHSDLVYQHSNVGKLHNVINDDPESVRSAIIAQVESARVLFCIPYGGRLRG